MSSGIPIMIRKQGILSMRFEEILGQKGTKDLEIKNLLLDYDGDKGYTNA